MVQLTPLKQKQLHLYSLLSQVCAAIDDRTAQLAKQDETCRVLVGERADIRNKIKAVNEELKANKQDLF